MAENRSEKIVILGTGGTIAGIAAGRADNIGYSAAQLGVDQLLDAVPGLQKVLGGRVVVTEQVAQVDSKDMSFAIWQELALRVSLHLAQSDVKGIVITHGTDTLEETAFFLHAALPVELLAGKPVVLTCAMRPASSTAPDGPQNLMDAITVAASPGACGVLAVCSGTMHGAVDVRKVHPYRLDPFSSGDAGPLGFVEEGFVRLLRDWPSNRVHAVPAALGKIANLRDWPRVEIVMNYVGASGAVVDALVFPGPRSSTSGAMPAAMSPVQGLVIEATGNGTLHHDLELALLRAQAAGVKVLLSTRCTGGRVLPTPSTAFPDSQGLSPAKARVALMLELME